MSPEIDGRKYYRTLDVCREAHLSRSTLLRWLKEGVIEEPIRDRRGWRIFNEEDLERIKAEVRRTSESKDVWRGDTTPQAIRRESCQNP